MEPTDKPEVAPDSKVSPEDMSAEDLKAYINNLAGEANEEDKPSEAPVAEEEVSSKDEELAEAKPTEEPAKADTPSELDQLKAELKKEREAREHQEKQYKTLQAEFTRTRQADKAKEKGTESKADSRLAQLKKVNPEGAEILEEILEEKLSERLRPLEEERVIFRARKNQETFVQQYEEFKKSDMAEIEPMVNEVLQENPQYWTSSINENPHTFSMLLKEAIARDILSGKNRVVEIKMKKKAQQAKVPNEAGVLTKQRASAPVTMATDDYNKMSLEELSKIVPRA